MAHLPATYVHLKLVSTEPGALHLYYVLCFLLLSRLLPWVSLPGRTVAFVLLISLMAANAAPGRTLLQAAVLPIEFSCVWALRDMRCLWVLCCFVSIGPAFLSGYRI
jgi:hypothetical protein